MLKRLALAALLAACTPAPAATLTYACSAGGHELLALDGQLTHVTGNRCKALGGKPERKPVMGG